MKRRYLLIIFNALLAFACFFAYTYAIFTEDALHNGSLKYFTEQSNMLGGIVSTIIVIYAIITKKDTIPRWLFLLNLITTSMLTLTFLTVVFYLAPYYGSFLLFGFPRMFFVHFLDPMIAIFTFIFINNDEKKNIKDSIYSIIPVILYTIVWLIIMLVKQNDYIAPYPFLYIYRNPIWQTILWAIGMPVFMALIGLSLILLSNLLVKFLKKNKK